MDIQDLIKKAQGKDYIRVNMNSERDIDNIIEFCSKIGLLCLNGSTVKRGDYTKDGGVKVGISVFICIKDLKVGFLRCVAFATIGYGGSDTILIPSESLLPYRNIKRGLL